MSASPPRPRRLAPEVRRRQLLDAALDVLAERGFDAVTVEAVAARAGVTRPVMYDMFGDLKGLMLALLDREEVAALAPLLEIVGGDPGDADPEQFLIEAILAFLRAVRANPRTWRLVLTPPRGSSAELRNRIRHSRRLVAERVTELLDWGVARRGGPHDLDHPLAARLIVAAGEDAARLMLAHPRRFPPERLATIAQALLALLPADAARNGAPMPALELPEVAQTEAVAAPVKGTRMPQAKRREQLLDVSLALLAQEGFDALSMEAVARHAGVNRVVVYRSFANIQVLLVALLRREDLRTRATLDGLIPKDPAGRAPALLLGEVLAGFLHAVACAPQTWSVALLRPESAPQALQRVVNRRRAQLARRLEPLVRWGIAPLPGSPEELDIEVTTRMLLSIAEEQGRLALEDPGFPPARLLRSSWALLNALPSPPVTSLAPQ